MKYNHLKDWFVSWFKEQNDDKIKVYIGDHARVNDVFNTVSALIVLIDSVPEEKRRSSSPAQANKRLLQQIRLSIQAKAFKNDSFGTSKASIFRK